MHYQELVGVPTRTTGEAIMNLPAEVKKVVAEIVRQQPTVEAATLTSQVISTVAGRHPNVIIEAVKTTGGTAEFVQAILDEINRVKASSPQPR